MQTLGGRLRWVDEDARLVITARAIRSFAQSAVAMLIAIYLDLQSFSLVQVGARKRPERITEVDMPTMKYVNRYKALG